MHKIKDSYLSLLNDQGDVPPGPVERESELPTQPLVIGHVIVHTASGHRTWKLV